MGINLENWQVLHEKISQGDRVLPHFCRDDTTCNCRYIFAEYQTHMGSVAEVSIGDGKCGPLPEEAKANAHHLVITSNFFDRAVELLEQFIANGDRGGAKELIEFSDKVESFLADLDAAAKKARE